MQSTINEKITILPFEKIFVETLKVLYQLKMYREMKTVKLLLTVIEKQKYLKLN